MVTENLLLSSKVDYAVSRNDTSYIYFIALLNSLCEVLFVDTAWLMRMGFNGEEHDSIIWNDLTRVFDKKQGEFENLATTILLPPSSWKNGISNLNAKFGLQYGQVIQE